MRIHAFRRRAFDCRLLAILLAVTWPAANGFAEPLSLDPRQPFSQYQHQAWGRAHGLPQNSVGAIVQTTEGYLWLATQDGLARFDGVRFTVFDKSTTPEMANSDITALVASREGRLWIGTAGGGLLQFDGARFLRYTVDDGLRSNTVTALYEAPDGALWIGTQGGGLVRLSDGRFSAWTMADGLISDDVTVLTGDEVGTIWIGTRNGLTRLKDGRLMEYPLRPARTSDDIRSLYAGARGTLWIGTTRGLAHLRDGRVTAYQPAQLGQEFIPAVFEDRVGTLWIGTRGNGLVRASGGRLTRMKAADGLSEDDVIALYEDSRGTLWIGCHTGGLNRLTRRTIDTLGKPEGLSHDIALPIMADRAGAVWVGTYGGGVNQFKDGRWSAYTTRDGLSSNQILSLFPAADGSVWVGTRSGLDRIQDGTITAYGTRTGVSGNPVVALYEDRAGVLWIGTPTGLIRFAGRSVRRFTTKDGLSNDYANVLHEDRSGNLWIGTQGGGLSRRQGNTFVAYTSKEGFPADIVWAIHEDAEGTLWLGTNGEGLIRFRNGRFTAYTTRQGLFNDVVFQILPDAHGSLWMSSHRGLSRVVTAELDALDAGRITKVTTFSYGEADGIRNAEANGGVQPAGWKMPDGTLWFPTIQGIARVDPSRMARREPLHVLLEEVLLDNELRDPRLQAVARPGTRTFEFRYTALGDAAAYARFRYRLDGFDEAWIDAGTSRTARYTNIPPGNYRLQVAAANEQGGWTAAPASLALVVSPRFNETYWFYAACLSGMLLLGGAFYGVRVGALKSRQQELMALIGARARAFEENARLLDEVKQQHRRFENLLETVPGVVWEAYGNPDDARQRIAFVSAHIEPMLGYSVEEWLDSPNFWLTIVHPEDKDRAAREAAAVFAAGSGTSQFRWIAKDGRTIGVEACSSVIRDEAGTPIGMRGVTMDVSQRLKLEDQYRQAQKMEAVGRLAGGIAHDFNNLLTAIIGNSDLLSLDAPDSNPRFREAVSEIRTAADRAAGLTQQLLAFSRRQRLEPTVLDLGEVVTNTVGLLRRLIGEDIELSTRIGTGMRSVRADRGQLEQVIMNLAVNARDAMPRGGKLTIETSEVMLDEQFVSGRPDIGPGRYVVLAVTDTGHGMDAETQAHIFEPFFTTKEMGKGTGLGLATVYGIITQSGGQICVYSETDRGTTFKVYLPQVDGAALRCAEEPVKAPPPRGTETVLLVEDEPGVRSLARKILARSGYRVLEASNAEQAIIIARDSEDSIALVLTDCVMPKTSGAELADQLSLSLPNARILFMSGYTDHAALHHGIINSGAAFLQKPFTVDGLATVVRQVLDGPVIRACPHS